jgi:large subunit ribosomal protein L10
MTREEKNQFVDNLAESLTATDVLYIADTSELSADATSDLRRSCFKKNVQLSVVKNTLLKKAIERVEEKDFSELTQVLTGPTAIMFSEVGNAPAKLIKEFRKKHERPLLKAAYVEEMCFIGDDQLTTLSEIKSREELIGDVVMLLQSPAKNVVSALQSGGKTLAGLVKTLSEKE